MNEVGTFDDDTRPTADQVEEHIDDALALVRLRVPPVLLRDDPDAAASYAAVVALETAAVIEKSYWPEQINSDRSSYTQLVQEFNGAVAALQATYGGTTPGENGGGGGGSGGSVVVGSWTLAGGRCVPCPPSQP